MSRKKIQGIFLLFILFSTSVGYQKKIIKDDLGFPYNAISPPKRIISLAPNITEILFALDLGEKVVGVTRYCDYPKQAREKEKIGGMIDLNLEKTKALNPDLIIGFRGNPLKTLQRLRDLHLPVFVLEMGTDIESVFCVIEKIGTITQREKKSSLLLQSLRKKYIQIQSALLSVEHEPKIFLSLQGMSLWTCGKKSFLNDLIKKAKGKNIAGNIPRRWLLYNREQLIHEDPEVIIILTKSQKEFSKAKEWIKNETYFKGIKALETGKIYFLDENLASRPGPRLIDALDELAHLLHPQHFKQEQ